MKYNQKKIVLAALFAAFACVATMSIRIPTPGTGGYIHPGDAVVILSGVILGPYWGLLAAGIGSALADLLGGYFFYVPITFVIKGAVCVCGGPDLSEDRQDLKKLQHRSRAGGIADTILVGGGYFLCEAVMYGAAAAAASVPANLVQGVSGLVLGVLLYPVLMTVPDIRRIAHEARAYS